MEYDIEIDILRELLNKAPVNSVFIVNGFYNEILSQEYFQRLFDKNSIPKRSENSHYNFCLTRNFIQILNQMLDEEGDNFIADITHFAIKYEKRLLATSYDGISVIQVDSKHYVSSINSLAEKCDENIEIKFLEKINDHGFFD